MNVFFILVFVVGFPIVLMRIWIPYAEIKSRQLIIREFVGKKTIPFDSIVGIDIQGPDWRYLCIKETDDKVKRLYLPSLQDFSSFIETLLNQSVKNQSLDGIEKEIVPKQIRKKQLKQLCCKKDKNSGFECFFQNKSIQELIIVGFCWFFLFAGILFPLFISGPFLLGKSDILDADPFYLTVFVLVFIGFGGTGVLFSKRKKLSIVTLAPERLEIQTHWDEPVYRIPYTDIISLDVIGPNDALLRVKVHGKERLVRLPMVVFSKKDRCMLKETLCNRMA